MSQERTGFTRKIGQSKKGGEKKGKIQTIKNKTLQYTHFSLWGKGDIKAYDGC